MLLHPGNNHRYYLFLYQLRKNKLSPHRNLEAVQQLGRLKSDLIVIVAGSKASGPFSSPSISIKLGDLSQP